MTRSAKPIVTIVAPILMRYDAISYAARDTFKMLSGNRNWDVKAVSCLNEFDDIDAQIVNGPGELLLNESFKDADVLIYHFGIYNPLFDAVAVGNGRCKQIICFHNITPAHLVSESAGDIIERSFRQLNSLGHVQRFWAVSHLNAELLAERGHDRRKTEVIPLAVDRPELINLEPRLDKPLELLFVGRAVQSKGLRDAIQAFSDLKKKNIPARLSVAGNLTFSDQIYLEECKLLVSGLGLSDSVRFLGTVEDDKLSDLYKRSHILVIPSYHEGFCVPVVEGLRAGCIPVGYAEANLPFIANGLGKLVATGDVSALGDALLTIANGLISAKSNGHEATLALDRGPTTVLEFDRLAKDYVRQFEFSKVAEMTISRVKEILVNSQNRSRLGAESEIRPEFTIIPDNEMRERERLSLNRLPDISEWEPGTELSDMMRDLGQPICIHRKSWEYAICITGLRRLGVLRPDASGLAVGAGSEPPLFYMANHIERMVATDLYDNPTHEGNPAMLADPKAFAPFPYREDRLEVLRMPGDALEFADGTFDLVFTLSSIEHFGSRATQRKAVQEIARVLKPGGIACIITELILTGHSDAEYFNIEEIDDIFLNHPLLELVGGDPDLSISTSLVDYPVDLENSRHHNRSPHIMLKRGEMRWTSFSMFFRRKPL